MFYRFLFGRLPRISERHYLASGAVLILKHSRCLGRESGGKKKLIPTELEENAASQLFLAAFLRAVHIRLRLVRQHSGGVYSVI